MTVTVRGDWRLNVAGLTLFTGLNVAAALNASTAGSLAGWSTFAVVTAILTVRLAMARIVLTSEGVRMYGWVRNRFFRWAEVAQFDTVQQWAGHTARCVVVRTTDGGMWSSMSIYVARDEASAILHQLRDTKIQLTASTAVHGQRQDDCS
jgi:hypothetical protein